METLPSTFSYTNEDQKNLKQLLDAFGSVVSLDDIASAYCLADRNLVTTGEVLLKMQGSTSGTSMSVSQDGLERKASVSSEYQMDNILESARVSNSKAKKCSASMGTVSCVIGREYSRHRSLPNESCKKTKPLKLNSNDFPVSEIWDENAESDSPARSETMHRDIEQFLFKMLGDGFQLEMDVIQDVVGQCGYDIQMSMDKLLSLSTSSLGKKDDIIGIDAHKNNSELEDVPFKGQPSNNDFCERSNADITTGRELRLPRKEKEKQDLQNEVLQALFNAPERIEEKPERIHPIRGDRQRTPYGRFVAKPPEETTLENITFITRRRVNERSDENGENSYEDLRKAVKEYRVTMKEYFKAAIDAFTEKDHEKSQKFLQEGQFFMKKAREADETSAAKLLENSCEEEEFSLNVHLFEPKEAVRMLRLHLSTLSGLPSVQHLKVIVGTNEKDAKEGLRKRMIIKVLDRESIPFTEDESGKIITIRVDEINPEKQSFAKKS
ncbi:putative nuclear RNA export factor SDE5 isoform X2 [Olea europaea var. sylvestris]|uniref:putative nuclear RNA export factor SDE5 isoform X2 n=1 Tax=Olea europaea var. sylvestris TaxID=158386 RepID=UPI000C1CD03D|nr:putative nuclear RNA export factor SDE5 isoform X2 [Olea europaea var. sylvestris]